MWSRSYAPTHTGTLQLLIRGGRKYSGVLNGQNIHMTECLQRVIDYAENYFWYMLILKHGFSNRKKKYTDGQK